MRTENTAMSPSQLFKECVANEYDLRFYSDGSLGVATKVSDLDEISEELFLAASELAAIDPRIVSLTKTFYMFTAHERRTTLFYHAWKYVSGPPAVTLIVKMQSTRTKYAIFTFEQVAFDVDDPELIDVHFTGAKIDTTADGVEFAVYLENDVYSQEIIERLVSRRWLEEHYPGSVHRLLVAQAMGLCPKVMARHVLSAYDHNSDSSLHTDMVTTTTMLPAIVSS